MQTYSKNFRFKVEIFNERLVINIFSYRLSFGNKTLPKHGSVVLYIQQSGLPDITFPTCGRLTVRDCVFVKKSKVEFCILFGVFVTG